MVEWLTGIFGEQYATYALYALVAVAILLVLWVLRFWLRRTPGGVFLAGGRGRQPRLAVVDAAAVDSHRRIVLIRRDDVEHLVMIGGHNDLVVERDIGKAAAASAKDAPEAGSRTAPKKPVPDEKSDGRGKPGKENPPPAAPPLAAVEDRRPAEAEAPAAARRDPPVGAHQPVAGRTAPVVAARQEPETEPAGRASPAEPPAPAPMPAPRQSEPVVDIAAGQPRGPEAEARQGPAHRPEPVVEMPPMRANRPPAPAPDRNPDEKSLENEMEKLLAELSDDK